MHCSNISKTASWGVYPIKECVSGLWVQHKARVALTCGKYLNWWGISHSLAKKIQVVLLEQLTQTDVSVSLFLGKNWDFTAALSDFEQLRQVHAGNLSYSFTEERTYLAPEKEMARVGRPILHRQDEVVQGEVLRKWVSPKHEFSLQFIRCTNLI